jgi:hypothetical protein
MRTSQLDHNAIAESKTRQTMAKKSSKKVSKPLAADEPANRPAAVYPLDKPAQNRQRAELSEMVATGTQAVKPSAKPTPAKEPPKLLTPLAAARPKASLPEPPKSPEKAAVVAQAPKPTATKTVNVSFALFEPDAKQVSLCGDFNGWASDATPMKGQEGGHWETTVALAPGRYQYKFVVDGHWIPDPLAHENVWNQHGTLNSVIEVPGPDCCG